MYAIYLISCYTVHWFMLTEVKLLPLPLKFRLIYVLHHLYFHVKCAISDGLIVRILKFQFSSAIVLLQLDSNPEPLSS